MRIVVFDDIEVAHAAAVDAAADSIEPLLHAGDGELVARPAAGAMTTTLVRALLRR